MIWHEIDYWAEGDRETYCGEKNASFFRPKGFKTCWRCKLKKLRAEAVRINEHKVKQRQELEYFKRRLEELNERQDTDTEETAGGSESPG